MRSIIKPVQQALHRSRLVLADRTLNQSTAKSIISTMLLPLGYLRPGARLTLLDLYLRFNSDTPIARRVFQGALREAGKMPVQAEPQLLRRSIIIKEPSESERGVLLTSFEPELAKLSRSIALPRIQDRYDIIFIPTWQPFYSVPLYQVAARMQRRLILMPSSRHDFEFCRDHHDSFVALPFQASSWVHPRFYRPDTQKDIDIVMLANFKAYKRHWHLFRALRELPEDLRVVIVGVPLGFRTRHVLLEEARLFGVEDRFTLIESPSDETVADLLSRSRAFLGLSAKEGSYIAVAEALFSNTPIALYRNAVIGSKDYVNDRTGTLLDPAEPLAPQIREFLNRSAEFSPAEWAAENIAAPTNCVRLNAMLEKLAREQGEPWTRRIAPFYCRHFDFFYDDPSDEQRFEDVYQTFREEYGITVQRPVSPVL